jgi:hypothetical protein
MGTAKQIRRAAAGLAAVAVCLVAGVATAGAYSVAGTQTVVDEENGIYAMHGDLVGEWRITAFKELATTPLFQARGRERFEGCRDRGHDGSCDGDPSGTLRLRFRYWALFASDGSLRAGACWHPIVGGTGAFRRARGVIQMLDAPTIDGVETTYVGTIRKAGRASATAARGGCG